MFEDVRDDLRRGFVVTKDPLEISVLPQVKQRATPVFESHSAAQISHECPEIRIRRCAFHEQVQMVRHEDVRKGCKLAARARVQNLQHKRSDDGVRHECLTAICDAASHEIPVEAAIVEECEARRATGRHANVVLRRACQVW